MLSILSSLLSSPHTCPTDPILTFLLMRCTGAGNVSPLLLHPTPPPLPPLTFHGHRKNTPSSKVRPWLLIVAAYICLCGGTVCFVARWVHICEWPYGGRWLNNALTSGDLQLLALGHESWHADNGVWSSWVPAYLWSAYLCSAYLCFKIHVLCISLIHCT